MKDTVRLGSYEVISIEIDADIDGSSEMIDDDIPERRKTR